MPSNPNLVALAGAVRKALGSSLVAATKDEAARKARLDLLDMLPELERQLLGPKEALLKITWNPMSQVSLHYLTYFKLAEHVPLDSTTSYKDLAMRAGVDEAQLRRMMRHAMLSRIFQETEKDSVAHTPISRLLATDSQVHNWMDIMLGTFWPATTHAVAALARWPGSTSPKETSVSVWKNKETTWFEVVASLPGGIEKFRDGMYVVSTGEGWEDEHLVKNFPWGDFEQGIVVDIGGANGYQRVAIAKAFPKLDFVIQELAVDDEIVAQHKSTMPEALRPRIEFMAHDMFTEQPIKGADVYFFRNVLHNWADEFVVKALKSLVPALKSGARIVIQDNGLAEPGSGRWWDEVSQRNVDIMSMVLTNSKEREQNEWKTLFGQADPRFKWLGAKKPDGSKLWIMDVVWKA